MINFEILYGIMTALRIINTNDVNEVNRNELNPRWDVIGSWTKWRAITKKKLRNYEELLMYRNYQATHLRGTFRKSIDTELPRGKTHNHRKVWCALRGANTRNYEKQSCVITKSNDAQLPRGKMRNFEEQRRASTKKKYAQLRGAVNVPQLPGHPPTRNI